LRLRLAVPSVTDVLYDAMRQEILSGEIPGGTLVTEMGVASRYAVARPTGKAAIERLSQQGLLRRDMHRSARVPVLTEADIHDVYTSRALIERQVVSILASERSGVPDSARNTLAAMSAAAESNVSPVKFVEADIAFHLSLLETLGSTRLTRMYSQLMGETQLCMAQVQFRDLLDPGVILAEHVQILSAIDRGDASGASTLMNEHLMLACSRLIDRL
jgi:DNA-binding GntR family transcriptional regulator